MFDADKSQRNGCFFNLREASYSQNTVNYKVGKTAKNTSKYRGVSANVQGKWQAKITHQGKKYYLGMFPTEDSAAIAYNEKAFEFFGVFAQLNEVER